MMEKNTGDSAGHYREVLAEINHAATLTGRTAGSVTLVAVSKFHPAEQIVPVLEAGQRVFGENRVQEAAEKWPPLHERYPGLQLHLIGPLQTNKVKQAVALFDTIETVDRPKLARLLAEEMARQGRRLDLLVQINTGAEPQKAGVLPADADQFIRDCLERWQLSVRGLMCIPPFDEDPSKHFTLLANIATRHNLPVLSMGMSADFTKAIALGATHVRVGTSIFGSRPNAAH